MGSCGFYNTFFAYQIGTLIWMYIVPWKKRRMMFVKDINNRLQFQTKYNNTQATFIEGL